MLLQQTESECLKALKIYLPIDIIFYDLATAMLI
jgi:hypothetical protein